MGKKKDKAAKQAKVATGFTLPDELRQQGAALLAKANSPAGREMIAAGLTMAAAAATAAAAKHRAKAEGAAADDAASGATTAGASKDPQAIADALGNVADAMFKRFFAGKTGA